MNKANLSLYDTFPLATNYKFQKDLNPEHNG